MIEALPTQVSLMDSDLRKLAVAVALGKLTLLRIRQNVALALASKAVMLVLAALRVAPLWLAIVSDVRTPDQSKQPNTGAPRENVV